MKENERAAIVAWLRQKAADATLSATGKSRRFHRRDLETEALTFALAADAIEAGAHLDRP